jgi:glycosyltransferase involved in cell wall biosynthesis
MESRSYPLVSVVTPSYNALPYLVENIESVQTQNYPAIEHIVIDGASTDGTQEVLQQYPHLVWVSEPDRGQSDALNKGFRQAKGDIIGWLNADDTYQPGAIAKAVEFLMAHPGVDIVYSDLQVIDESSRPVGITKSQPFDLFLLPLKNYIKQPTIFMRRQVIEKLGGLNEDLHYVMDREFWLRAGLADFKMHYLTGQVLANFRLCQGTKSFEQTPKFRTEWLQIIEMAFQDSRFDPMPEAAKKRILRKNKASYYVACMVQSVERRERIKMFRYLVGAAAHDWTILANRGTWRFVGQGILGLDVDRLKKFKKSGFVVEV